MKYQRDRDFVDVVGEVAYWRDRFTHGTFAAGSFDNDCVPVIKQACDIFLRNPNGSVESWLQALCASSSPIISRFNREITRQVAQLCWLRLNETN